MKPQRGKAIAGGLLLLSVLTVVAVVAWRLRPLSDAQLDEAFKSALSGLDRGEAAEVQQILPLLDADPDRAAQPNLLRAVPLLRAGRYDDSLDFLKRVPGDGPFAREVLLYQGEALNRLGRPVEAQAPLLTLLKLFPDDPAGLRWLAISYYDLGAYEPARYYLTKLIAVRPDDLPAHRLMGLMYYDFGELADAITHYRKALELSPPDEVRSEVTQELADSLIGMRQFEEARSLLVSLEITAPKATLLLARCEFGLGSHDQAQRLLDSIPASEQSSNAQYFLLKAELLAAAGHDQPALTVLQDGIQRLPFDTEIHYRLGLQLQKLGLVEKAAEQMIRWNELNELSKRLTELNLKAVGDPADVDVRLQLAEVCTKLGKQELADMWAQSAAEARKLRIDVQR